MMHYYMEEGALFLLENAELFSSKSLEAACDVELHILETASLNFSLSM